MVSAWSETRLVFEPRGWQLDFRENLRVALRGLADGPSQGLLAQYDAPAEAFVDLENVLLYNVGMAVFGPVLGAGVTCRRGSSADGRHYMRYQTMPSLPDPGGTRLLASVAADLGGVLPSTAGQWWSRLRPGTTLADVGDGQVGFVTVDVLLAGPKLSGTTLANAIKPMLDGLISCFHAHDGSRAAELQPRVTDLDPAVWRWLLDPSTASLGVRQLVRPYRSGIAWNPADDLCRGFRVRAEHADRWTLRAELRTLAA
jgi:hypothetical protein